MFGYRLRSTDVLLTLDDSIVLEECLPGSNVLNGFSVDIAFETVVQRVELQREDKAVVCWVCDGARLLFVPITVGRRKEKLVDCLLSWLFLFRRLAGLNRVGLVAATPLFADLTQPLFSPDHLPFSFRNVSTTNSSIRGVCGVDLDLDGPRGLSKVLASLQLGLGNGVSFVFNVDGEFLAANNRTLLATDPITRGPVLIKNVNNAVVNATMKV